MKNKKSFLLYTDLIHTVNKLPDQKAGELFKFILSYVNDENPKTDDLIIEVSFEPIKQSLKRDLVKYKETCDKNRENILKRWNKKNTNVYERIPDDTKHTDNDSDNDSDNDIIKIYYTLKNFKLSITDIEYNKLLENYTSTQIHDIFDSIDNHKGTKNRISLYKTSLNWLKRNNIKTNSDINSEIYKKECNKITGNLDNNNTDVKFYFKLLSAIKEMPDLLKKDAVTFKQCINIKNSASNHSVNVFNNLEIIAGSEEVRYNKALNVGLMTWIKNNSKSLN